MSFYIIEGPNGVGKTTLINSIRAMGESGEPVKALSSPGETALGKMLRPACRGVEPWEDLDPTIKFMLFSAVRYDEYLKIVKDSSQICFADRWWTSTYVYQCIHGNIEIPFLENTIHPEEKIDTVFLLNGDPDVLIERLKKERALNPKHGNCSWTQDEKTIREIISIYKNNLPPYLKERKINTVEIDVTKCSKEDVKNKVFRSVQETESKKDILNEKN